MYNVVLVCNAIENKRTVFQKLLDAFLPVKPEQFQYELTPKLLDDQKDSDNVFFLSQKYKAYVLRELAPQFDFVDVTVHPNKFDNLSLCDKEINIEIALYLEDKDYNGLINFLIKHRLFIKDITLKKDEFLLQLHTYIFTTNNLETFYTYAKKIVVNNTNGLPKYIWRLPNE